MKLWFNCFQVNCLGQPPLIFRAKTKSLVRARGSRPLRGIWGRMEAAGVVAEGHHLRPPLLLLPEP